MIWLAWNIQFLKGSDGRKADRCVWEGGLFTDPASFPQRPRLSAGSGGWPFFYRHHEAKEVSEWERGT